MGITEKEVRAEQLFARLIKSTKCPFATKAQVEYGEMWSRDTDLPSMVHRWADELRTFVVKAHTAKLDGIILSGHGKHVPSDLHGLAECVRVILSGLTGLDRGTGLTQTEIEDPGWQFSFGGERMFLVTFASLYSANNARHSPVPDSMFMFFQPEFSFDHFMPYSEHDPRTHRLKAAIRRDFTSANMTYDLNIVGSCHEALKYIKPLNLDDPPVKWWKSQNGQT